MNITKESLVKSLERLLHIRKHIPSGSLTLKHTKIIVGIDK